MFAELKKYKNKGFFTFTKGEKLSEQSKYVPNLPGVYFVESVVGTKKEIVYIGKSGTYLGEGQFSKQQLRRRINNSHDSKSRQTYFEEKLKSEAIESLKLSWFVTFDDTNKDLPAYVEALLIQDFFDKYKRLPRWNREF